MVMELAPRHADSTALLKVVIVCGFPWCWTEKAEEIWARKAHGSTDSPLTRTGGSEPYFQAFLIPDSSLPLLTIIIFLGKGNEGDSDRAEEVAGRVRLLFPSVLTVCLHGLHLVLWAPLMQWNLSHPYPIQDVLG